MKISASLNWVGCILVGAGLSACAGTAPSATLPQYLASPEKTDEPQAISDPNEQFNRSVFESNQKFNHAVLYPVAKAYNANVPENARDRISAFTTNISEPGVFANDVLQLRPQAAATTLGRFVINSTLGLGGLFDVAAIEGMSHQSGDFGQTLYVWGYRDSAYAVLPILGPTNVRDALGGGIEFAAQLPSGALPTRILSMAKAANSVALAVDIDYSVGNAMDIAGIVTSPLSNLGKAEDMQTLEESSIDFYSMLRSVSDQKRQAELQEALATSALTGPPPLPDPNAIEPVMTIASSPTMLEKPKLASAEVPAATVQKGGTIVVIGPPTPIEALPAQ